MVQNNSEVHAKEEIKEIFCVTVNFKTPEKEFPEILIRWQVLSQIATIFDPMGYAAPVVLCGKLLMREVIVYSDEMGIEWDDLLPRNIRENGIYSL